MELNNDILHYVIPCNFMQFYGAGYFMSKFIGREQEISRLRAMLEKKTASFIVIRGRRRIGKSRLIEEFSKNFDKYYSFMGLPPEENTTRDHQLEEFSRQIAKNFNAPKTKYDDWSDAFWAVGERVQSGKILLFFDEISWLGDKDPTFLGKIKNFWDQYLKKNDNLVFIVCGSASSWIEKNILNSSGFVGRISFVLTLRELPMVDCSKFWPKNISSYEKFKVLAVTGGIPKYLEEINPKLSAEENIKILCFTEGGLLVNEFEQIFSDLFLRDSDLYKKIIIILSNGPKDQAEIRNLLKLNTPGRISEYLAELELAGFVTRSRTWNLQTGNTIELSNYRLTDNYLRFYLNYIDKNLDKINRGGFTFKSLNSLPEWSTIISLQFENLILSNVKKIHETLGINPSDIICENPYFQNQTTRHAGCQIDYMVQTKFETLYICEIKFSKKQIGCSVIDEVQDKIAALQYSKRFSCRPVLIHVNGVTEELVEADYFSKIIDASSFFD